MSVQGRFGTVLEKETLLAADSFANWGRKARTATGAEGQAFVIDPGAREQFVHAVDAFLDTPPIHLVSSKQKLPQPAPVSEAIAATALKLPEATGGPMFVRELRTGFYKDFLMLLSRSPGFRAAVIRWGGFQLLSTDVLLGYVVRMEMPFGQPLVEDETRAAFAEALLALEQPSPQSVVDEADALVRGLGLGAVLEATRDMFDSLGFRHLIVGASYVKGLRHEIEGYVDLTRRLGVRAESAVALFLLAYVGRACMSGWHNANQVSRQLDVPNLVYLAHHMRSAFLHETRQHLGFAETAPRRLYWWSWGSLLARALEQDPGHWSAQALTKSLKNIHTALRAAGISISLDAPEMDAVIEQDVVQSLQVLARNANIVAAGDEDNGLATWAPALARMLPMVGADRACEVLATLTPTQLSKTFVASVASGAPEALQAFYGANQARGADGTIGPLKALWLAGQRAELSQLYSEWDNSLDDRTAHVALTCVRRSEEAAPLPGGTGAA